MTFGEHHKELKRVVHKTGPKIGAAHLTTEETILLSKILDEWLQEKGTLYPLPIDLSKERMLRNKFKLSLDILK